MDKQEEANGEIEDSREKTGQPISNSNCDASCEKGKHDAASIVGQHAREIPSLTNQQIDKGNNILNPMADKRQGIIREEAEADHNKKRAA
jgi:hypothetical protein